jgi:phosphomannomutase/phosphoglucomutase
MTYNKSVQIPTNIFRGYDLRGVAHTELTADSYYKLGMAYGSFLAKRRVAKVVVGRDVRVTSEEFSQAFIAGLVEVGTDVIDIGLSLTQIIYFAQYHYLTKGGAMVTASHNPKEYNGLKLGVGYSETMVSEEIQELRLIAETEAFVQTDKKGSVVVDDVFPAYKDYLLSLIDKPLRFKVLVDAANGTTGMFLPQILREAGCEVIERNTNLDGNFPLGTPDPTEEANLKRLAAAVVETGADLGFSYDADGDRVGVVDGAGNLIWNDVLVALFAADIIDQSPGAKIVYNALCSKMVLETINNHNGTPVVWKTGHSFIKAKVREERALFGGELSGHFFFMDNFFGHDDGAYASLRLLSYLQRVGQTLEQAVQQLPKYISSPEIKVGCPDALKFAVVSETIGAKLKQLYPQAQVLEVDGVRLDWDTGMIIFRASQNGPYLTIKFEAKEQAEYDTLRAQVKDILHSVAQIDLGYGANLESLE